MLKIVIKFRKLYTICIQSETLKINYLIQQ